MSEPLGGCDSASLNHNDSLSKWLSDVSPLGEQLGTQHPVWCVAQTGWSLSGASKKSAIQCLPQAAGHSVLPSLPRRDDDTVHFTEGEKPAYLQMSSLLATGKWVKETVKHWKIGPLPLSLLPRREGNLRGWKLTFCCWTWLSTSTRAEP